MHTEEQPYVPKFTSPTLVTKNLSKGVSASLIAQSNDISLVIDENGIVRDVAVGNPDPSLQIAHEWIGKPWIETVASDSTKKIEALLEPRNDAAGSRWRQVNHPVEDGLDLPVMYKTIRVNNNGMLVAVGRDLRQVSQLQQQLLDVQHSLERDYARLHQAEIRYRMLFSMATEAMLFVDADSRKIVEANPAAGKLLDTPTNKLLNRGFPRGFSANSNDSIEELLLRVRAAGGAEAIVVRSATGSDTYRLSASLIRREDGPYFLIRLSSPEHAEEENLHQQVLDVVNRSPDAFVVTDPEGRVLAANKSFLDYCSLATELQVINQPIDQWLGRPGVDLNLLLRNLRDRTVVEHFLTTLFPQFGDPIDVELSAVSALDSDVPCYGFVLRRQLSTSRPGQEGGTDVLPRSLEEMTQLVGRVPLKDLVRETTDIIERLCIEAALKMTGDSRAAAAEMLGLSRQSLYVKLRRYGVGEGQETT